MNNFKLNLTNNTILETFKHWKQNSLSNFIFFIDLLIIITNIFISVLFIINYLKNNLNNYFCFKSNYFAFINFLFLIFNFFIIYYFHLKNKKFPDWSLLSENFYLAIIFYHSSFDIQKNLGEKYLIIIIIQYFLINSLFVLCFTHFYTIAMQIILIYFISIQIQFSYIFNKDVFFYCHTFFIFLDDYYLFLFV